MAVVELIVVALPVALPGLTGCICIGLAAFLGLSYDLNFVLVIFLSGLFWHIWSLISIFVSKNWESAVEKSCEKRAKTEKGRPVMANNRQQDDVGNYKSVRELATLIIAMHKKGKTEAEIVAALDTNRTGGDSAQVFVREVLNRYHNHNDILVRMARAPFLGQAAIGATLVFVSAVVLSFALGVVAVVFDILGLGGFGEAIVALGEKFAGALVGLGIAAMVQETGSPSLLLGCGLGIVLYYVWLAS